MFDREKPPQVYKRQQRPVDSDLPIYEIAYSEAQRAVNDQIAELDGIRQRSVQFLSFVGAATAFLVGTSIGPRSSLDRDGWFVGLAVAASVCSLLSLVLIVLILRGAAVTVRGVDGQPGKKIALVKWEFTLHPDKLIAWLDANIKPDLPQFSQALIETYEGMCIKNEQWLRFIRVYYAWFITVSIIQLGLWASVAWHNG